MIAASCLSTASQATVVFSDNFNAENGGATALQYTNFTNFNVTGTGVDLVGMPNGYGIVCPGACVDLDGTPGPGGLASKLFYSFNAGDHVTLTFDISGNQRSGLGDDTFYAGFNFGSTTTIDDYTAGGPFPSVDFGTQVASVIETGENANGNSFSTYVLSFTATSAGAAQVFFRTDELGNIGPLLDNVSLDISGAPEPETWAMLLLGFFGIGAMMRFARHRLGSAQTA